MPYQPIENYGLIGNLRTAALVGHGRLDRLAVPAALRLAQRLRRDPRRREGRPVPHRPAGRRVPAQAVLLAGHQRPDHPVPAPRRHRRGRWTSCPSAGPAAPRRTSSSAGCGSSAAGCRSGWSAGRRSTTPAPGTTPRSREHGARFDGPGLSLGLAASVPLRRDGDGVRRRVHPGRGTRARRSSCADSTPATTPATAPAPARRRSGSARPSRTGSAGCRTAPTRAAGARWCSARPWR